MIKAVGLKKKYGEKIAVDGVGFDLPNGVSLGLLGPNGAGKTTTIKMLLGLLPPTSGEVFFDDKKMSRDQSDIKKDMGLVSQHISLQRDMTPRETLNLHGMLHKMSNKQRVKRINELLQFAGLYEDKDALIGTLSGGNKRKLMIIRSVMHEPKVLFLDEPTVGLDAKIRRSIWDLLKKLKSDGMSILLTTHYIEEAKTLCDEIAMIKKGKIIAKDTPQGFLEKEKSYVVESFDGVNTEYKFFGDRHEAAGFAENTDLQATIRRTNLEDVYIRLTDSKLGK